MALIKIKRETQEKEPTTVRKSTKTKSLTLPKIQKEKSSRKEVIIN